MKLCTVNPEYQPRRNGNAPEAMQTKRNTERNSRPELLTNHGRLELVTRSGICKLYKLQWDITSPRQYMDAMQNAADIAAKAWILLYEAEQEQSEEQPIFTIIRAIREWIRETRSNGVSFDETTEDADGNTMDRWSQQPAHNNTEAEALTRYTIDELTENAAQTRITLPRETIREYYRLRYEEGYRAHTAAETLNISSRTKNRLEQYAAEHRNA